MNNLERFRSSRLEVFCKKDVLKNFAKFTGNHLCQSLFLNKVAGPFPVEHLRWLLLEILRYSKAATEGALLKKMLKILQILQENTYVRVCF